MGESRGIELGQPDPPSEGSSSERVMAHYQVTALSDGGAILLDTLTGVSWLLRKGDGAAAPEWSLIVNMETVSLTLHVPDRSGAG